MYFFESQLRHNLSGRDSLIYISSLVLKSALYIISAISSQNICLYAIFHSMSLSIYSGPQSTSHHQLTLCQRHFFDRETGSILVRRCIILTPMLFELDAVSESWLASCPIFRFELLPNIFVRFCLKSSELALSYV